MALQKDMELWQIKSFFEDELKEQILLEIAPILYIGQEIGGYFGVTRQILCFFDFLSATYCGYNGKDKYSNGAKKISTPTKVRKFMDEMLNEIDPMYKENGKYLYAMYRHGLVHLYQPRTIKLKNGRVLKWAAYKGARERVRETFNTNHGSFTMSDIKHLGIISDPNEQNSDYLTVSITCLYKDLLTVIDLYYQKLEKDTTGDLLKKWRETANAILEPEDYSVIGKEEK